MTNEQREMVITALNNIAGGDNEYCHEIADQLILEALDIAGYQDIADAWRNARKRIGFWYA